MSVKLYDEALCNKIQSWIKDQSLRVLKPDEVTRLWQMKGDIHLDKPLTLPLISIARNTNVDLLRIGKHPMSFDGKLVKSVTKVEGNPLKGDVQKIIEGRTIQLDAIPISLSYQLDIYTKRYDEADEYLRNFIFNLTNSPRLYVEIPYNSDVDGIKYPIRHTAFIRVVSPIQDNSGISNKLFADQFTRWTINLLIDDAYLFSRPIKENVYVDEPNDDIIDNESKTNAKLNR